MISFVTPLIASGECKSKAIKVAFELACKISVGRIASEECMPSYFYLCRVLIQGRLQLACLCGAHAESPLGLNCRHFTEHVSSALAQVFTFNGQNQSGKRGSLAQHGRKLSIEPLRVL